MSVFGIFLIACLFITKLLALKLVKFDWQIFVSDPVAMELDSVPLCTMQNGSTSGDSSFQETFFEQPFIFVEC